MHVMDLDTDAYLHEGLWHNNHYTELIIEKFLAMSQTCIYEDG